MNSGKKFHVLLYYNFVVVPDSAQACEEHEEICKTLGLLGRILIAKEGINGTVSGETDKIEEYKKWMGAHPLFHATEFKENIYDHNTFHKLHVRVKNEIVHFGLKDVDATVKQNNYIEPEEFREILKNPGEDIVILDARSNYETKVGKFKHAIHFDIDNFRELPDQLDEIKKLQGKKIITYCTGGIKCEKVTTWMKKAGIENVYQLHGGIIRYGIEAGGEDFEGSCYVFDERVVVPVNEVNPTIIGKCEVCESPTEKMVNCANPECNIQFLTCEKCAEELEGCCSKACAENPHRRTYDGTGFYLKGINSKLYVDNPDPNYIRMKSEK